MSYDQLTGADLQLLSRIRVTSAVKALREFGAETLEAAAIILPMWRYYGDLTEMECRAVLDTFQSDLEES